MFKSQQIEELVALLERRGVSLFHACQYVDFCAYLELGGIPSRALLERNRRRFTVFETDTQDQQNGVWDKVFVNLSDFGQSFARGLHAVPNPFGPIVIQVRPFALAESDDVAICLRSAGATNFRRERETLRHVSEVDNVFLHPVTAEFPQSAQVKTSAQLHGTWPGARMPEVSCTIPAGLLPLSHVIVIWTDPYMFGGRPLGEWIKDSMRRAGASFRLWDRFCDENRRVLYAELLGEVTKGCTSLQQIKNNRSASVALRVWAAGIQARGLEYQFRRYATYLINGTIRPLAG